MNRDQSGSKKGKYSSQRHSFSKERDDHNPLEKDSRSLDADIFSDSIKTRIALFIDSEDSTLDLEAMNSFKRRIIHTLAKDYHLDSESRGNEGERYVCLVKHSTSIRPDLPKKALWDFGVRTIAISPPESGLSLALLMDGSIEVHSPHTKNVLDTRLVYASQIRVRKGRILEPSDEGWDTP